MLAWCRARRAAKLSYRPGDTAYLFGSLPARASAKAGYWLDSVAGHAQTTRTTLAGPERGTMRGAHGSRLLNISRV